MQVVLEANFGKSGMTWTPGDFNGDGKVSFADYLLLEANFGRSISLPSPPPSAPALVTTALAVPTTVTAAKSGLAMLRMRR